MDAAVVPVEGADSLAQSLPAGYRLEVVVAPAPMPEAFADAAVSLLADPNGEFGAGFADTWGKDLRRRAGLPGSIFGVVRHDAAGSAMVAHCMVAYDPGATPSVGLVGHVFTSVEHRRRGLSKIVLKVALATHEAEGGRHWILGTGSPGAAALYQGLGFGHLNGGFDGGTKGYNESDLGEWIMVRSIGDEGSHLSLYEGAKLDQLRLEPFARRHWAAATLLLNAFQHSQAGDGDDTAKECTPSGDKLPTSGLGSGLVAEEVFLKDILASDEGTEPRFSVLVNPSSNQVQGVAIGDEQYLCGPLRPSM